MPQLRVAIVCPGLGIADRGFERASRDAFEALREEPSLDVHLVKGRGPRAGRELVAPTVSRESRIAKAVAHRRGRHDFWLEQLVFSATVQPHLLRLRPDVVMLGEWTLTRALGVWRRLVRQRYRILLYNGAGVGPPYPDGADHIQQLTPDLFEQAVEEGEPPERQTVLPHALEIPEEFTPPAPAERRELRARLGLPSDRLVVLSVGALNLWHKRMDYLVNEIASMSPRPFLALLGARDEQTPELLSLARDELGDDGFALRTVAPEEVGDYYRAADVFALASGYEPFGLALVEALANGLPVVAQDTPRARYILGEEGALGDFVRPGALAPLVAGAGDGHARGERALARHRRAHEMFSWQRLRPRYVEMLGAAARKLPREG
jgi:glycosyltransferase involved in cell wall biosynthesis